MPEKELDYEKILDCIHCGLCLPYCPSYAVLGTEMDSPRGRIFMMKSVADGIMEISPSVKQHFDSCLACRGCETACPSGVQYHALLEPMQAKINAKLPRKGFGALVEKVVLDMIFPYPARLKFSFALLRVYQKSGLRKLVSAVGLIRLLPENMRKAEKFLPDIRGLQLLKEDSGKSETDSGNVAFLRGCVMDFFYPDTNAATRRVLEKLGYRVAIPEQHCCGAIHHHSGHHEKAKEFARQTIDSFLKTNAEYIIVNAAGCGAMLKEYGELLKDEPDYAEKAQEFSRKVKDISEFLADKTDRIPLQNVNNNIVFDPPCHQLHGQKVQKEPMAVLQAVPGLNIIPLKEAEMCCGSAGTFNITQPDLSMQVLERKMENINATDADAVVTANVGCMIQLQKGVELTGSNKKVYHVVDIFDRALQ